MESSSKTTKKFLTTTRIVWISISVVLFLIILVLGLLFFIPRCCSGSQEVVARIPKRHDVAPYAGRRENLRDNGSLVQQDNQIEKGIMIVVSLLPIFV